MFRITHKIKTFRVALLTWNKNTYRRTDSKIKEIKQKIKELDSIDCQSKRGRRIELKLQLSEAYKEEELFWSQKARIHWLKERDRNTSFFHASVQARRKMNNISCLHKDNGEFCVNGNEMAAEISRYYENLYASSMPYQLEDILEGI
ncbi:hypothetical protein ACH5RR_022101 [Cinchona calisaya]|uniref:Uncharacterized protein n=1 Tax=Cinchona calisaya TaxID=153742 RepID=A0ABD2Z8L2_9GENT